MFKKVNTQKKYAEMEKEIVQFWKKDRTFEKSVTQRSEEKMYSFYDGPPFITGVPHYGTLLSSIVKDAVPRYWTMKGFRVERRWGWDCHGLPAENMVEKKLEIKSKKEIEEKIGIDKFNEACFRETSQIASEWEEVIDRIGRWVEFKGAYKTMDKDYMESVWWAFSQLHQKGLIYEDVRVSLFCPRCSTPLSNFEIAMDNSYEMDSDPSVFVKVKMKGEKNTFFLVWTTTPWTLPANVALAVGKEIEYVKVTRKSASSIGNIELENPGDKLSKHIQPSGCYIVSKDAFKKNTAQVQELLDSYGEFEDETSGVDYNEKEIFKKYNIELIKGKDLVDKEYEPIFPHEIEKGYRVISGDFVTTEEGTGIVHIAPAFGEDDFQARKTNNLPIIMNVDEEGQFTEGEWQGKKVWEVNGEVVKWLKEKSFLFKREQITHSYPHCHRCHTKLIYKAQPAWYVNVDKIRKNLLEKNENINWFPEFLKHGRFQNGIETAPDWNISRDRYFGTAIPVWKCTGEAEIKNEKSKSKIKEEKCNNIKVIGSYEELKNLSGVELPDYHRPKVDEINFKCEKCGGIMKRIPQVFDSWIESGSMPFAQFHYPFENKEKFEKSFPTDFISEYIAQTRAWFYVLHVISVGIFEKESFKNVVTTGTIAGSDGKKMSKSLGNYTLPNLVLEKYSADALRFYLLSSPLLNAQNINFSEKTIGDIQRKLLATLWNSYSFFILYAGVDDWKADYSEKDLSLCENLLDRWIVSELNILIALVDEKMQNYDLVGATKPFELFVDHLSNWYIRRSRKRFWKSENDSDKNQAYATLHFVLVNLSKILAPFCPFISEEIYQNLTRPNADVINGGQAGKNSVHLEDFPSTNKDLVDEKLNQRMRSARKIVSIGLQQRALNKIKVRQPLAEVKISEKDLEKELLEIIQEELNVKKITVDKKVSELELDLNLTLELKQEGAAREIIRAIQGMRKEAGYQVDDHIQIAFSEKLDLLENFQELITHETLADKLEAELGGTFDFQKELEMNQKKIIIGIKR